MENMPNVDVSKTDDKQSSTKTFSLSSSDHFKDHFLQGILLGIAISIAFVGIVTGGYFLLKGDEPVGVDNINNAKVTSTTKPTNTVAPTTVAPTATVAPTHTVTVTPTKTPVVTKKV